jgi:prophage maintenance system killer protein
MEALRAAEVLWLHGAVAARLGERRGVADVAALATALREAVEAGAGGGLFELAAGYAGALAQYRPFHAGNLAVAAAAAGLLLRRYDLALDLTPTAMPELRALLIAGDREALADWLREHTVPLP